MMNVRFNMGILLIDKEKVGVNIYPRPSVVFPKAGVDIPNPLHYELPFQRGRTLEQSAAHILRLES